MPNTHSLKSDLGTQKYDLIGTQVLRIEGRPRIVYNLPTSVNLFKQKCPQQYIIKKESSAKQFEWEFHKFCEYLSSLEINGPFPTIFFNPKRGRGHIVPHWCINTIGDFFLHQAGVAVKCWRPSD